jgi:hypothetical protein
MKEGFDKETLVFFVILVGLMALVFYRVDSKYDDALKDTKLQRKRTYDPNQSVN